MTPELRQAAIKRSVFNARRELKKDKPNVFVAEMILSEVWELMKEEERHAADSLSSAVSE